MPMEYAQKMPLKQCYDIFVNFKFLQIIFFACRLSSITIKVMIFFCLHSIQSLHCSSRSVDKEMVASEVFKHSVPELPSPPSMETVVVSR